MATRLLIALRRVAAPLFLLAASTVVALLAAEGGLRLIRPQVFPTTPAGLFTERPDGFRVLTAGFEGVISRAEFKAPVSISEFGVRGPGPGPRRPNTFRILALGDSQTFGFGVLDHAPYPVRLQQLLAEHRPDLDIQVVNAGVPGYGTVDELVWLRDRGAEVDPDLILVQFLSVNDFKINRESSHAAGLLAGSPAVGVHEAAAADTGDRGAGSLPAAVERPGISAWVVDRVHALKRRSHLATLVSETGSYIGMRLGLLGGVAAMWGEDFTAEDAERTRSLMVLLAREAQAMGVPVIILYTTGKAQVIAGSGDPLPSAAVIAAAAREAGVPWLDMAAELRAREDRQYLYFIRDGHWTAAGHQAVAEVVAERLSELGVLP